MTGTDKHGEPKPVLSIVSFVADSRHILGHISFRDRHHMEFRMYVVEANPETFPARVFPALDQALWDDGDTYQGEAERIARTFIDASFPTHAQDLPE